MHDLLQLCCRCVKGCESDENCIEGEECVAREIDDCLDNTYGDCPAGMHCVTHSFTFLYKATVYEAHVNHTTIFLLFVILGICVPYRCKDYSETMGGTLIGKNVSATGQMARFKCKKGYFMPNLTDPYSNEKQSEANVQCTALTTKLVPVSSIKWNFTKIIIIMVF